jgi:hypothetical protein
MGIIKLFESKKVRTHWDEIMLFIGDGCGRNANR